MLKNYLKTAFRNFRNNTFYSSLNIIGLATGFAAFFLIMVYVQDELSYDRYHVNARKIYRINNEIKLGSNYFDVAQTPALLGPEAVKAFPQIQQYTRLRRHGGFLVKKGNTNLRENRVTYGDSTLFEVFTLPMISGNATTALTYPRSLVITETIARKYFNRTDVAGRYMTINDTTSYKITGVIKDIPKQSHFNFDFFVPFAEYKRSRSTDWLSQNFNTYLLLKKDADPHTLQQQLNTLLNRFIAPELKSVLHISMDEFTRQGSFVKCSLTPLTAIHLHSNMTGEIDANGDKQYVYSFSVAAGFILIIACVNFMNLFTARSSNRAREVGVRKVLGSQRKNLIQQFLTESLLTSCVALLIALFIIWPLLPFFNQLTGKAMNMSLLFRPSIITVLLSVTILVGLLSGSYPALLLSAFQPIEVLKGKLARGLKDAWLRNALVVLQFSLSILLIAGTLVIYSQLHYISHRDIGYNRQQVVVIHNTNALKTGAVTFQHELLQLSGVRNVTMTGYLPVDGIRNNNAVFTSPALDVKNAVPMQSWYVDERYIPTLGIRLLEGRNFSPRFATDSMGIIINEAATHFLETKELLNKKLYVLLDIETRKYAEYHIIGIIKNFHFSSMHDAITPLALFAGTEKSSIAMRLNASAIPSVITKVKNKWQSVAPGQPFDYSFLDEEFDRLYDAEQRTGQLFIAFALLAIIIACLGLLGLVAYAAEQRIKEIGIRKVLGASVINIISLLSFDFLKLVIIAALVSCPIAWWGMHTWLQSFAYRIDISWQLMAISATAALFIAAVTVSFQAIKASTANPVNSLRAQ